jgi:hypothetical protein
MLVDVQRCAGLVGDLCHRLVEPARPQLPSTSAEALCCSNDPLTCRDGRIDSGDPLTPVTFRASLAVA